MMKVKKTVIKISAMTVLLFILFTFSACAFTDLWPFWNNGDTDDSSESGSVASSSEGTKEPTMDYETYMAMSSEEQYAFFLTFENPTQFVLWYNEVKEAYEKDHPVIVINPGDVIDVGE